MRSAMTRLALLAALTACGRATPPASAPAPATAVDVDEAAAYRQATAIRGQLLAHATWADMGGTACNPGALRTFERDTTKKTADEVKFLMTKLEGLIVARGLDTPLTEPTAHALLRDVITWEAGATRPNWDVEGKEKPRPAIAAGLAGEFLDPATGKCDSYIHLDTVVVILPPGVGDFRMPTTKDVALKDYIGEAGLKAARDTFYATVAKRSDPVFTYTKINPAVIWRDFAVVTVNRPAEDKGVVQLPKGAGGSTYIFHRVGNEWRLLVIARTWG